MGTEYYLINHENCTVYDLGKCAYKLPEIIEKNIYALCDNEFLYDLLLEENSITVGYDADAEIYWKNVCKSIKKFVGFTNEKYIKIINDCCENHIIARCLKYDLIDSRFINSENELKQIILEWNKLVKNIEPDFSDYINEFNIQQIISDGWNFKNISQGNK